MYERILVPLDGSPVAEGILPYVEELAAKFGSEVLLLETVPALATLLQQTAPGTLETGAAVSEMSVDLANQQLEVERRSASTYLTTMEQRLRGKGIRVQTRVGEGAPATQILEYAKEADASLIAMSTHGRGGLQRLVFGSVTDEVLRNSALPLLLVRPTS